MTRDIQTLLAWLHAFLWIAAVCTTLFPVLYSLLPWYKTTVGRVLMLQGISLASAIDLTLLFQYWEPEDILVIFWVNVVVFGLIAISSIGLILILVKGQLRRTGLSAKKTPPQYDGKMIVDTNDERKRFTLELDTHPDDLEQKDSVTFKVVQ